MGKQLVLSCILAVSLCIIGAAGSLVETMAKITQQCCSQGLHYARISNHTSQDCSSSVPPEVPSHLSSLCIFAMDGCCKEFFEKKWDCNDGVEYSSKSKCSEMKSSSGKSCCSECERGRIEGEKMNDCRGSLAANDNETAESSLANDAFIQCCEKAKTKGPVPLSVFANNVQQKEKAPNSALLSVCEEYAPTELCAHHCIPLPGSYRCECNPGYMLMADGKNCRLVQKNRCKPRNHCQHKCNDNGVGVKCSCRRGYRLMSDGKSCEDIDECKIVPSVCIQDTSCHNIQGSYKCIPGKKQPISGKAQCPPGFVKNQRNGACDDIDECALPAPPCPLYSCQNSIGGYSCDGKPGDPALLGDRTVHPVQEDRCPSGFRTGVNEECEDVDECKMKLDNCDSRSQFCINTRGLFYCQDKFSKHCAPGFMINTGTNICEDIDECLDSHSLCRKDQICVNVPGAYDCKPKTALPRQNQRCTEGFRINPRTSLCEDIDECAEGTHMCDMHQNCLNVNGSHECRCKLGFELDPTTGACVDINECAKNQNECFAESQRCDNTIGSYVCVRTASCGTGYTLLHSTNECEDIDECGLDIHNCARAGPNYQCVNMPGTFRCMRRVVSTTSTTTLPDFEYEYYDSDEDIPEDNKTPEKENENDVSPLPTTLPSAVSSTVSSTVPSTTPSTTPTPTEPLPPLTSSEHPIDTTQLLESVPPEPIENEEPEGEEQTYNNPDPLDKPTELEEESETEKVEDTNREPNVFISNDRSSTPKPGLGVSQVFIEDTSEDAITVKGVQNQDGSVSINTQDIPKSTWTKISKESEWNSCNNGFEPNENDVCIDIDECAIGKHICSGLTEVCRNTIGGYVCDCAPGFRRDAATNICDIPITSSSSTSTTTSTAPPTTVKIPTNKLDPWVSWGYPVKGTSHSRPFRPRNSCDVGYRWNTNTARCEDIDECVSGVANCAVVERCVNTEGGYVCECPPGWRLDETRQQCLPGRGSGGYNPGYGNGPDRSDSNTFIKEVVIGASHGNTGSKFVDPTLTNMGDRGDILKCPRGYWLGDDHRCVDIDECVQGTSSCGLTQICINLPGGYTCSCPDGYQLANGNSCEDVNECLLAGNTPICSEHADCLNTQGSYQCRCHQGFRSAPADNKVCMDMDECSEARAGSLCQHRCNNVWGTYRCSCFRGYRLNSDNRTCSDVDECTEFASKNLCVGRCLNEPGSYRCSCPQGYRLSEDKRSCIDIDECDTGEASCAKFPEHSGVNEVCLNTRGSYRCNRISCLPGYALQNKHRCTRIESIHACALSDWACIHQPTTYSYHYITFVSNLYIPATQVNLFTMRGLSRQNGKMQFQLRLLYVNAPPTVQGKADIHAFKLTTTNTEAVLSLVTSLPGPQSIELELSMAVYGNDQFEGIAVAKLFIYVSEYTF